MKRHYLLAFSAGYFVSNVVAAVVIKNMTTENNRLRMDYKKLYEFGLTVMTIVEEKHPELMDDPRIDKILFEDMVERL